MVDSLYKHSVFCPNPTFGCKILFGGERSAISRCFDDLAKNPPPFDHFAIVSGTSLGGEEEKPEWVEDNGKTAEESKGSQNVWGKPEGEKQAQRGKWCQQAYVIVKTGLKTGDGAERDTS